MPGKKVFFAVVIWTLSGVFTSATLAAPPTLTISGFVRTSAGVGVAGVSLTGDNGAGSAITGADGSYTVTVPNNWTGTIIAAKTGWLITPTSQSYYHTHDNLTSQNYTAFQPTISGYTGLQGVTLTASDVGSVVSDSSFYYSITVPYNWSGTLTASLAGYSFPESPRTFSNITADISDQNFTPYQPKISGYVKKSDGTVLSGVSITSTNGGGSSTTNASGFYEIIVPYDWSGTVSASLAGYGFTGKDYISVISDQVNQNFAAFRPAIYGYVKNYSGSYLSGVVISASGAGSATTNSSGYYTMQVPYGWSGNLAASRSGYYFGEPSIITSLTADLRKDFTEKRFKIRGYVLDKNGVGVSSVSINASGLSTVSTSSNGYYELTAVYGWSGTVTPAKTEYGFNPANRTYTNISADFNDQNYTAIKPAISGTVTNTGGVGIAGVTISAGAAGSTSTDPNGKYALTLPYNWSGTITPSKTGYGFNPASRTYTNITTDMNDENYIAKPTMDLNKTLFSFTANGKTGYVAPQNLTLSNSTHDAINWQIQMSVDCNWLSITPQSGTVTDSNSVVNISVDPNQANYGVNSCQLTVISPDTANSPQIVTVNLEVLRPKIGLSITGFNFISNGKTGSVAPKNLTITNTGYDTLNWQIQMPADGNWLSVTPQSGIVTDGNSVVTISVDPSKAKYGMNYCRFTINAPNAQNNPQTLFVFLRVYGPSLSVSPTSFTVYAPKDSNAIDKTFTITNTGYDTLHWSIDPIADYNWITSITPMSGQCEKNEINTVTFTINPAGLTGGTYSKIITIRSAETSQQSITVNLRVAKEIHVPGDYATTQSAVNAAANGDIIIIHPGKYAGFSASSKSLTIQSIEPENRAIVAATIIESEVTMKGVSGYETVINGLSFIYNPLLSRYYSGRGISLSSGDSTIKNCIIRNFPCLGIYLAGSYDNSNYSRIINCRVIHNGYGRDIVGNYSAGIYTALYGNMEIKNCLIANNFAGGVCIVGNSETDIFNCTISDNSSNNSVAYPSPSAAGIIIANGQFNPYPPYLDVTIKDSIIWNKSDSNISEVNIPPDYSQNVSLNIDCSALKGGLGAAAPNDCNIIWGLNNLESDPCFVRLGIYNDNNTVGNSSFLDDSWTTGDYHLKSQAGRWQENQLIYMDATGDGFMDMSDFAIIADEWQKTTEPQWVAQYGYYYQPYLRADLDRNGRVDYNDLMLFCVNYLEHYEQGRWVMDDVNSPCIDAGDPNSDWTRELWPHGQRVNMGAYGNTPQASFSLSAVGNKADLNNDGLVNLLDYAQIGCSPDDSYLPAAVDIDRDGVIDMNDLVIMCENWLWME